MFVLHVDLLTKMGCTTDYDFFFVTVERLLIRYYYGWFKKPPMRLCILMDWVC